MLGYVTLKKMWVGLLGVGTPCVVRHVLVCSCLKLCCPAQAATSSAEPLLVPDPAPCATL